MERRFRPVARDQLFLMPPDVREWLPQEHPARFLVELVEQLELSGFVAKNESSRERGRPAYHPVVMVGIVLYASMCTVTSSRRIARLLVTDVGFRVVAANERPDHATISRFLVRYGPELDGLFAQVVGLAAEAGLVDPTLVAVDGTKMAADASPARNVSAGDLRGRYRSWLATVEANDAGDDADDAEGGPSGPIPEMRDDESMRTWIRQRLEDLDDVSDDVRVNETDPDSGLLPRSGGGWVQGYNAQAAAVAGGVVVAADITANPSDATMLEPMTAQIDQAVVAATGEHTGVVVADAGYWTTEVIDGIEADDDAPDVLVATGRQVPATPPEPLPEPDLAAYEAAVADFEADIDAEWHRRVEVIARVVAGELLIREGAQLLGLSVPTVGALKLAWERHGGPDAIRPSRLPGRRRPPPPKPPSRPARARHEMDTRLASPAGRSMYRQRQAIIEPVFGDVKTNRRITRFLRRGLDKVRTDWHVILTGHNLTIIHQRAG
jgi:transposase